MTNRIPTALHEALHHIAIKIKDQMPGCALPECSACHSNQLKATALANEAAVAALRWALNSTPDFLDDPSEWHDWIAMQDRVIAVLEREAET